MYLLIGKIKRKNVFEFYHIEFFRQLIYDYPEQLFAENGVMAIEHADFEGVERLAQVLGKRAK
jgi:chaperonin GroEL (HSP60 family)